MRNQAFNMEQANFATQTLKDTKTTVSIVFAAQDKFNYVILSSVLSFMFLIIYKKLK